MLRPMHITPSAVICAFPRNNATMLLRVEALQAGALRITRTLREDFLPVARDVVIHREPGQLTVTQDDHAIRATAGGITAVIDRTYGSITFTDEAERVLLREDKRRPCDMQ